MLQWRVFIMPRGETVTETHLKQSSENESFSVAMAAYSRAPARVTVGFAFIILDYLV